jgi:anti-sigma B factor antagonist
LIAEWSADKKANPAFMSEEVIQVQSRESEGCMILDIKADNFTYPHTSAVKEEISEYLALGKKYFVLNVNDVKFIDSYGLATIVAALKLIKDHNGALALYGLNTMFEKLLKVTHLDKILEVWPNESQATYYLSTLNKK